MNLRNTGTIISPEAPTLSRPSTPGAPAVFRKRASSHRIPSKPARPTAITIKHQILVLNVHSNKRSLSHGFFANIFTVLDRWRLSVDLISTSEVHISMALHSESEMINGGDDDKEIVDASLRGAIHDLAQYGTVDVIDGMAILSLVGKQMKNMTGIAALRRIIRHHLKSQVGVARAVGVTPQAVSDVLRRNTVSIMTFNISIALQGYLDFQTSIRISSRHSQSIS